MADSDNSMTLSFVTRRRLLAGTALATLAWPFQGQAQIAKLWNGQSVPDPATQLWEEWKAAARKTQAFCRKQQRLESLLVRDIGFPRAIIRLRGKGKTRTVYSPDDIEDICGADPSMVDLRAKAEAELVAHQARWDAADEQIGYAAAKREEKEAGEREQDLADALTAMPATSLAGIAAKLDMVIHEGEIWDECTEFPWPQIRSALRDLVRIGQAIEPNVFIPGSHRWAIRASGSAAGAFKNKS